MRNLRFMELDCVELSTDHLTLRVTQSVGPRIVYLALPAGKNLLAEVPDFFIPPPIGPYRVLGGHRLWHGPEKERRTYLPDDKEPVEITPIEGGVHMVQNTDASGIQKIVDVQLDPHAARVTVTESLKNNGFWPIETYAWGLTQVRPGGFAILPQWTKPSDQFALLPNRSVALWTYTKINDPRLRLGDRYIFIHADPSISQSLKIGYGNVRGWIAYHIDRTLLVKVAPYRAGSRYPDLGCSAEIYTNNEFMELEVMSSLSVVEPGQVLTFTETWHLFSDVTCTPDENSAEQLVRILGLDQF